MIKQSFFQEKPNRMNIFLLMKNDLISIIYDFPYSDMQKKKKKVTYKLD